MIALDTNVLIRLFSKDDLQQQLEAERFIQSELSVTKPGWVSIAVLLELVWVITTQYKLTHSQTAYYLRQLISLEEIVVAQIDAINVALNMYEKSQAGFADCLTAALAKAEGCEKIVTFDRIAARDAGMTLLG
jgi:predicted nucleic-acid-binding protein